jgi:DNA-binding CsgD family transcriptional regulator
VTGGAALAQGRNAYAARSWAVAHRLLGEADAQDPLAPEDLQLLATSAYMLGLDDAYTAALERAHHAYTAAGRVPEASRCAFWVGHSRLFHGDAVQARGWFGRAQRALAEYSDDCVERGYLLLPLLLQQLATGDRQGGYATAVTAAEIGERFGDPDLLWLARDEQGRALVQQGRAAEALPLVDEVLVAVTGGELGPVVSGIVYCNTIIYCRGAFELPSAREWTRALTEWCASQPEMVEHNGLCLVHRAEILQLEGEWDSAREEAALAASQFAQGVLNQIALGQAVYLQGEIARLRGDLRAAEESFEEAHRRGHDPLPGLALLRLAQGNAAAAGALIRRAVTERAVPLERAGLLAPYVTITLALGETESADSACRELEEVAGSSGSAWLAAQAAQARGELLLGTRPGGALGVLRRAWRLWRELNAPYDAACTRVLLGQACRELGDHDSARLELDAARAEFERLEAGPDLARLAALDPTPLSDPHGLTGRELEVLRLLKAGSSNRAIAEALTISEHTVARHLQNIFSKLGVSTRTAASAYAFEHQLG